MNKKTAGILLVLALCLIAGNARAHKLNLYAYQEGARLVGEGYFKGGVKAQKAIVKVLTGDGRVRAQSVTAKDGSFSLPIPKEPPPYTITMEDAQGHKAEFKISEVELGRAGSKAQPGSTSSTLQPKKTARVKAPAAEKTSAQPAAARVAPGLGRQEMETLVSNLLDEKLAPIKAQLARQAIEDQVSVRDVVGGLGWILGLVGIAAWFKSRRLPGASAASPPTANPDQEP